jgi:hypothetical protein
MWQPARHWADMQLYHNNGTPGLGSEFVDRRAEKDLYLIRPLRKDCHKLGRSYLVYNIKAHQREPSGLNVCADFDPLSFGPGGNVL